MTTRTSGLKAMNMNDLDAALAERRAAMDRFFTHDTSNGFLWLNGGRYPIGLDRIPDYQALVEWTVHLAGKGWMDRAAIREFLRRVCAIKGWDYDRGL